MNGQNVSLDPATGLPENEPQSDTGKEGGNEDILFEKLAEFINKNELGNAVQTRVLKTKVFFFYNEWTPLYFKHFFGTQHIFFFSLSSLIKPKV